MARRPPSVPLVAPKLHLSTAEMQAGIVRLRKRLEELEAFNPEQMQERSPPELAALETAITRALEKTFGENTADFRRFSGAGDLRWSPGFFIMGEPTPLHEYRQGVSGTKAQSAALIREAIRTLEEDIGELAPDLETKSLSIASHPKAFSRRVFVVHGRDHEPKEAVARFLESLGFEAVILHEQANQGRTVIEKVEAHADVDFAIVLLTPDDVGRAKDDAELAPRPRQNVLLELGYFIGRLGRENVCALKRGQLEVPSDFAGVVWEEFDPTGAWRTVLGRELQAAGHQIDWNKIMGR
jgi:predicted nucleotide-binding protein